MEEDHPFHNLFLQEQPEHLFVSSVDGVTHVPLESQNSRVELWQSMQDLLSIEYAKRPDSSLKKIAMLLDKMDVVDRRAVDLERRRDELLEVDGPDSKKVRKLQAQLREVQEEREKLDGQVQKYSELELKRTASADEAAAEEAR
jgi:vacuolar-type H+-ATPase subunit I/STV1